MEDIHSSYLTGPDDVDHLPYPLPSLGQNEACAPMPCPGGVEIVFVGGGEPTVGAYPDETGVLPAYLWAQSSFSHVGAPDAYFQTRMRLTHSRDSDGLNCGILGRPEQDHLSSSKYTLPPPDHSTLHHFVPRQPGTHTTPWRYSDTHEDIERESDGIEEQYLQPRRFEWTSSLEDGEGHSQLMMVRSDPPSITMPAFRRALQLGRAHEAWQGGNYSEEDAHVEVEEEEEDEEGSVYTCIECSIYFKKKAHLLEHMFQHSQEGEGEAGQGVEGPHPCGECGKGFGDEETLESHRQLHQESRKKIIEEISKLESFADEGRDARLQCPKCLFGTNSSKIFVQHAKTHVKKVGGETRTISSLRVSSEMADGGETSEPPTEGMWKSPEMEPSAEPEWKLEILQPVIQGPSKVKGKTVAREEPRLSQNNKQRAEKVVNKARRTTRLPEAAVQLKKRFRMALRAAGGGGEDQSRQLREEVAVVFLENIGTKKKRTKGPQPCGYGKRLPINKTLFSRASLGHHLPREDWADDGEDDIPLDTLLTDPKYASQLEALGLRSEERECPYCPDRFHNGIGLANHVRGHLNRVGVSYNVRHFISAEEVKAIEQNYSFQKKRKKVANFDPSTFSLMRCEFCGAGFDTRAGLSSHARAHLRDFGITNWELTVSPIHVLARLLARSPGRPLPPFPTWHQDTDTDALASDEDDGLPIDLARALGGQPEQSPAEKRVSDQSTSKGEDAKGQGSITCELCGACFETRKGLASHARSHLRQLGILGPEISAPIDLLKELAKHGKLPKDESSLGAKKVVSPQQESSKAQWGDEDGPLNLSVEGESNRENDCQFCGAWFETRKGLSSHARAHLRHLGVTDPDAKGSPIATLNCLIKSEDFKKRMCGQTAADTDLAKAPSNSNITVTELNSSAKSKEIGTFAKPTESTNKASGNASANLSEGGSRFMSAAESGLKLVDSAGPIETSAHFRSPSGSGNSTQIKIVEAGAPRVLSPETGAYSKLTEAVISHIKSEAGCGHGKMEPGNQSKPSIGGLAHPKPPTSSTPPTKKMKTTSPSCNSNLDSYWAQKNASTPLNLSPSSEVVRCEFCGEFFENRKGLSSHARSHLRQMGVTEWHVNGSPIDTLREILASGTLPRTGTRVGGPGSEKHLPHHPPASPSGSHPYSGLAPTMQRKPARLPTYPASEWPSDLSPLNLSSQSDPTRDIRCEFCNEFFENRKGLSSHARSHLRQMGVTEWHVNGSPIDTLREIIRKRHPATPQQQVSSIKKEPRGEEEPPSPSHRLSPLGVGASMMARDLPVSPPGRPHNSFLSPVPTKRPAPHEPRLTQSEPKGYMNAEPKTCSQPKSYIQGESRPKSFVTEEGRPKTFVLVDGKPKQLFQSGDGRPKTFMPEGRPKGFLPIENRPKTFVHGEGKPKTYLQNDGKPKSFMPGENRPKPFLQGESKPKSFSPDGKNKAYIQTELPFKVKMKASPEKGATNMEAACELCGLIFENRKALASHARAHLRQFGVTEWCVNGSPIETLREWMKQRPQKAGAYLSYIQGRPFSKKFKRALQGPKPAPEKESPAATPQKVVEKEHSAVTPSSAAEKLAEPQGQKVERRHPKAPEVPPSQDDTVSEPLAKNEESRPPARVRPVPSLVPRPPQTSLVKFVGNIYTLKCRFCDIQFQGPLSIQQQWVRHLQHHILQMNFSKFPSPPHDVSSQEQPEAVKSQ
ncbi:PREDICTED: protein Wiz-like [Nanorana parkeri]|uniref:protein Wiz-like n=1 Tax=Nanorana parkeri TaxID=125878 RepID=UPI000854F6D4|nr:PREDICTED: protein Wiz-like [Nanorana parkeri]